MLYKEALMMKKMKYFSVLLGVMMSATPAFAIKYAGDGLAKVWGGRPQTTCVSESNFPGAAYIDNDAGSDGVNAFNGDCRRGYGRKLMVALDITDKGARFCPLFVYGLAYGWHDPTYTRYGRYGDDSNCVWLCLPGYTGTECQDTISASYAPSSADAAVLNRDTYLGKYDGKASAEIETSVPGFYEHSQNMCYSKNTTSENDMILAITGFVPSGHGAWVQQTAVTAHRFFGWGWHGLTCHCDNPKLSKEKRCEKHKVSINVLHTDSAGENMGYKGTLVCMNGYEPNVARDDCVVIEPATAPNPDRCDAADEDFDAAEHKVVEFTRAVGTTPASCKFRCAKDGHGFESAASKKCVSCPTESTGIPKHGVSASTGVCVTCADNYMYDVTTGECEEMMILKESDLMYGIGKQASKSSTPCWMAMDLEDYRKCIFGESTTGSGNSDADADSDDADDQSDDSGEGK